MLKETTTKLALSIFGSSIISIVLSLIIVMSFGGIGATNTTGSSSKSGTSGASSMAISSSSSVINSSAVSNSSTVSQKSNTTSSSLIQTSTGGLITTPAGKVLLGILCFLIFYALIYNTAWREGDKDPNRINYGHMEKYMAKGLVAGLLASIPYAIMTVSFVVTQAAAPNSTAGIILNIIYRICNVQYIVFGDGFTAYPVACILLLLILPVISELGYLAGYHKIVFISKIIYKNKKKPNGTYRKSINNLKK